MPEGVLSSSKGVLSNPKGVLSNPKGVLPNPKGVLLSPTNVLSSPKGVLPIPKKCCLINSAQSIYRFCKSKCKTAVLVAIAIPVFSSQLEKSREATDLANVRSAYATLVADYLTNTGAAAEKTINVPVAQKEDGWASGDASKKAYLETMIDGTIEQVEVPAKTSGNYTIKIAADGKVTIS